MKIKVNKILKKGKALFLAYDQGFEHGPNDFNDKNVDPLYIINIAKKGKYTGLIFHSGIAEKYSKEIKKSKIPLIIKLNGKSNLREGEPISRQLCSVDQAIKLGAAAVGYTIYLGSEYESIMLQEFEKIEKEAHSNGLPVIAWIYPRGKSVEKRSKDELMAYASRIGLEIGADMVKIFYSGNMKKLEWSVKSAGRTKVVIAGGTKSEENIFLKQIQEIMNAGCAGLAVGRNVWQSDDPLSLTKKIKKIIWKN